MARTWGVGSEPRRRRHRPLRMFTTSGTIDVVVCQMCGTVTVLDDNGAHERHHLLLVRALSGEDV